MVKVTVKVIVKVTVNVMVRATKFIFATKTDARDLVQHNTHARNLIAIDPQTFFFSLQKKKKKKRNVW